MKLFILLAVFFGTNAVSSETVTKNSAPFSFPTIVGVTWKTSANGKDLSFVSQTRYSGRRAVELSWSIPGAVKKGSISVYNIAGMKLATFPVSSSEGSVQWKGAADKKAGNGIYFAKLTCGSFKKNLKIAVY